MVVKACNHLKNKLQKNKAVRFGLILLTFAFDLGCL